jgi:ribosome-binding protein aMBF1 (putative translation factor)
MATLPNRPQRVPREIPEMRPEMVKADLRNPEKRDYQAEIGGCLERARHWLGWSLKECAAKLGRDERQVARWEAGTERTQVDVVMGVAELQQPFAAQLAKLSGADIHMHAEFRRIA